MLHNLRPETLKDIENIDTEKYGFQREELRNGLPADLPGSYNPSNVHVFLSTPLASTEWDKLLGNVTYANDVEKHMKALRENKSELVFPKNGGAEASRVTIFNLPNHPAFSKEEQRILVVTAATSNSAEPSTEAKMVSFPVSALLTTPTTSSSSVADANATDVVVAPVAPWNNAAICQDHSADRFVMICSHTKRDPRCGSCGAILVDILQQEIDKQLSELAAASPAVVGAFAGKIHVARCSHVGGHVHAGNVAVVSKDGGVMFGCVNPADVVVLARSLISAQPVVQSLMSIETLKAKVRGALLAGVRAAKF